MKSVLITGGAGFIGSHLAERMLDQGYLVRILDDLSTGSIQNIDHLKEKAHFEYFLESIFEESVLRELVDESDIVVHLAAAVGVKLIVDSPVRTIETNIGGTELVLKYSALKKKRVYLASTSEVYGKSTKLPFAEDDDLVLGATNKGRWSYACSKAIDEFLGIAYYKEKQLPTMIFRFFNTVGPRQTGQYGMVIPRFVSQALKGETLEVYGDGLQSRCFGCVADIIDGVMGLIESDRHYGEVFNIGSNEEIAIKDLAQKIIRMTGSASKIQYTPLNQVYGEGFEDMQRRVPDISKVNKATGYKPKYSLDQTLETIIAYFQNQ